MAVLIDQAVGAAQKRAMHHDTRDDDRANVVGHGANLPIFACRPRTRSRRFGKVHPKLIAKTERRIGTKYIKEPRPIEGQN